MLEIRAKGCLDRGFAGTKESVHKLEYPLIKGLAVPFLLVASITYFSALYAVNSWLL